MEQMRVLVQTMADRPEKSHFPNVKLDERNFRSCKTFSNQRKDWREWKRQFMSAVRECDTSFADVVWAHEKLEEPLDLVKLDPTNTQLANNFYNRLISLTTGLLPNRRKCP